MGVADCAGALLSVLMGICPSPSELVGEVRLGSRYRSFPEWSALFFACLFRARLQRLVVGLRRNNLEEMQDEFGRHLKQQTSGA